MKRVLELWSLLAEQVVLEYLQCFALGNTATQQCDRFAFQHAALGCLPYPTLQWGQLCIDSHRCLEEQADHSRDQVRQASATWGHSAAKDIEMQNVAMAVD